MTKSPGSEKSPHDFAEEIRLHVMSEKRGWREVIREVRDWDLNPRTYDDAKRREQLGRTGILTFPNVAAVLNCKTGLIEDVNGFLADDVVVLELAELYMSSQLTFEAVRVSLES